MVWILPGNRLEATELKAHTIKEWTSYVSATERRIAGEFQSRGRFLVLDFQSASERAEERRALLWAQCTAATTTRPTAFWA